MPNENADRHLREQIRRIDSLLQEVEQFKDPQARSQTRQIVQCLMDMHGAVFQRMLDSISSSESTGNALIDSLASDELISSLMLLYGLHPVDLETRVREALEKVRPYLHSHGGNVELLGLDDGIVRLRLHGSCHGCPSSAMTLKSTIEEAILEKAPDAASIIVEGESTQPPDHQPPTEDSATGRFALPILGRGSI